jgi:hypothetical protein
MRQTQLFNGTSLPGAPATAAITAATVPAATTKLSDGWVNQQFGESDNQCKHCPKQLSKQNVTRRKQHLLNTAGCKGFLISPVAAELAVKYEEIRKAMDTAGIHRITKVSSIHLTCMLQPGMHADWPV